MDLGRNGEPQPLGCTLNQAPIADHRARVAFADVGASQGREHHLGSNSGGVAKRNR
jgi:hypothetical protein